MRASPSYNVSMKSALFLAALLPSVAAAGNFATCLLDKLPEVQNDIAAQAVYQVCNAKHPGAFGSVAQGGGRGLFSPTSGAECLMKKGGETRSHRAAALIVVACRRLYDEAPLGFVPYGGPIVQLEPTPR